MNHSFDIPALTPELRFAAKYWREMDELTSKHRVAYEKRLGHQVLNYVVETYSKASTDAKKLILPVIQAINDRIPHIGIEWKTQNIERDWGSWGYVRKPGGTRRPIRWVGAYLDVGKNCPRLVLYLRPKSGDRGTRYLWEECRRKGWAGDMIVVADELEKWPGWEEEAGSLIYHVQSLHSRTALAEVVDSAADATKNFFCLSIPLLKKLSSD